MQLEQIYAKKERIFLLLFGLPPLQKVSCIESFIIFPNHQFPIIDLIIPIELDLAEASFAGQYETVLGISSPRDLIQAIKRYADFAITIMIPLCF